MVIKIYPAELPTFGIEGPILGTEGPTIDIAGLILHTEESTLLLEF